AQNSKNMPGKALASVSQYIFQAAISARFLRFLPILFPISAACLLAAALMFPARSEAHRKGVNAASSGSAPRLTSDLSGALPARDGDHLHLLTDLGNVIVHT